MASWRSLTLRRRLAALTKRARKAVLRREDLRQRATAAAVIGAALARAKIDPAQVSALRLVAGAERELLRIGDTPDLRRADAAFAAADPSRAARMTLAAKAALEAPHFDGRPAPERGAALIDWYAWSLAAATRRELKTGGGPPRDRRAVSAPATRRGSRRGAGSRRAPALAAGPATGSA